MKALSRCSSATRWADGGDMGTSGIRRARSVSYAIAWTALLAGNLQLLAACIPAIRSNPSSGSVLLGALVGALVFAAGLCCADSWSGAHRESRQIGRADMDAWERASTTRPYLWARRGFSQSLGTFVMLLGFGLLLAELGPDMIGTDIALWWSAPVLGLLATALVTLVAVGVIRVPDRRRFWITESTGATPLAIGANPKATRSLGQACVALGIPWPPRLYVITTDAVNAYIEGSARAYRLGVSGALLDEMSSDELVAVFANLLVRLSSGYVRKDRAFLRDLAVDGSVTSVAAAALFAAADDAAVLATRNPGALASALRRTASSSSTVLPGLEGVVPLAFFWTAPHWLDGSGGLFQDGAIFTTNAVEMRRLELLRPVASADAAT